MRVNCWLCVVCCLLFDLCRGLPVAVRCRCCLMLEVRCLLLFAVTDVVCYFVGVCCCCVTVCCLMLMFAVCLLLVALSVMLFIVCFWLRMFSG